MIIEGHDLLEKYRRLRILYNRTMVYSDRPFYYSYWAKHTYQTNLGPRTFICTTVNKDTEDEYYEFYYEMNGKTLFKIAYKKNGWHYNFYGKYQDKQYTMDEQEAWLAIHELEELSYKELEKYNEISVR